MNTDLMDKYSRLLDAIRAFRAGEMIFRDFSSVLRGNLDVLGSDLSYKGDFFNHVDAWLEYIEYCYLEEDWYELGTSVAGYIEQSIQNFPSVTPYPSEDRVLRDQLPQLLVKNCSN